MEDMRGGNSLNSRVGHVGGEFRTGKRAEPRRMLPGDRAVASRQLHRAPQDVPPCNLGSYLRQGEDLPDSGLRNMNDPCAARCRNLAKVL